MSRCKNETCIKEAKGSSVYCSDSCKTTYNRNKSRNKTSAVTPVTPAVTPTAVTSHEQEVQFNVSASRAARTNPSQLNYGHPMSKHELEANNLKANRVPIPGDHDYKGVCHKQDGKWAV